MRCLSAQSRTNAISEGIGQIILAFFWPILSVLVAAGVVRRFAPGIHGEPVVIPLALVFVAIVLSLSLVYKPIRFGPTVRLAPVLFELLFGACVLMVGVVIAIREALAVPVLVIAIYVGAAAEEFVFRLFLPNQLARRLRAAQFPIVLARYLAFVLPQIAFAASHALLQDGSGFQITAREFLRLVTAGVLYSEIVVVAGLGVATGIHAALNLHLRLFNSTAYALGSLSLPLMTLATFVLLLLRLRRPDGITLTTEVVADGSVKA